MITLEWDIPHDASTPRGWLFACRNGLVHTFVDKDPRSRHFGSTRTVAMPNQYGVTYVTLGHWLCYPSITDGKPFHAVSCVTHESAYFASADGAMAFIENQAKDRVAEFFAREAVCYEHERDTIRTMKVRKSRVRGARSAEGG